MSPQDISAHGLRELGERVRAAVESDSPLEALMATSILVSHAELLRLYADSLVEELEAQRRAQLRLVR